MKLPRVPKKLRVMVGWTLDLLFARDIEQMFTLRDVEALSELASRIRARATQQTSVAAASTFESRGSRLTQLKANLITVMK